MSRLRHLCVVITLLVGTSVAQFSGDVLGVHNLQAGGPSPLNGGNLPPCQYCHAPHSSGNSKGPLWAQTYSNATYSLYSSTTTPQEMYKQPVTGGPSSLCLSCHDGTVAPGQTMPYGPIRMKGAMNASDTFGTNLQDSHPFSFNSLQDSPDLSPILIQNHRTTDPLNKVRLVRRNVECQSCHDPHVQNGDPVSLNFLVRDGSSGQICLSCHTTQQRIVNGTSNPLTSWTTGIHSSATNTLKTAANVGGYANVAQNACASCHVEHNAVGAQRLLRGTTTSAGIDTYTQNCITCHNGNSNLVPALLNVWSEYSKTAHPLPSGTNLHDTAESVLLNKNRHATCVDCHNAHGAQQSGSVWGVPPQIRPPQAAVNGVLASDGVSVISPAQNQYETCLRCHGSSVGKQVLPIFGYLPAWYVAANDPLDETKQFGTSATSSHPVMHPRNSPYPQPSLRSQMLQTDGITLGRSMGQTIFCIDCHNSDDNREFGGSGPNGPHGSIYPHLLERRYEMSQVAVGTYPSGGPGSTIVNLFPGLQVSAGGVSPGPWALCGKCHDLNNVLTDKSFQYHSLHVSTVGVSCSTCHTAHGVGLTSTSVSGDHLVNFDANVVAVNTGPLGNPLVSYNQGAQTCTLTCHGWAHNTDGTVSAAGRNSHSGKNGSSPLSSTPKR